MIRKVLGAAFVVSMAAVMVYAMYYMLWMMESANWGA